MRAFIGIPVDETLTQQLQTWVKQVADTDWGQQVCWIPPQNYHLTLRFLGAKVAPQKLEQLQQTMAEWFAEGMSAFEADVMRIQRFPEADQGRFIVATLDTTLLLQCLLDEIQLQLKPLGFSKPQQRFRAHITLGRLPKVNELKLDQLSSVSLRLEVPLEDHWLQVEQLNLYQSTLTDNFPKYELLASKPLETY